MLKKEIGFRLRYLRKSRKDSLRALAEKIEVNYSTLHKIETGENYPSIDVLDKISKVYNVDHAYFFGDKQDVPDELKGKVKWISYIDEMETLNLGPDELKSMLKDKIELVLNQLNNDTKGDKDK